MGMKIAIMGATGQVGRKIVRHLIDSDHDLVLIARRPAALAEAAAKGARVMAGDAGDAGFLILALQGVETFYAMTPPDNGAIDVLAHYQRVIDAAVAAIRANGVSRVVLQSSYGAQHPEGTGPIVGCYRAEQALAAAAESFCALRNGYFMENFAWMAQPMRTGAMIPLPVKGTTKTSFVTTQDIARVAAETLADESWSGQRVREVLGPEDVSFDQVAALISQASGRNVAHLEMSDEMAAAALAKPAVGFSPDYARLFIELHRAIDSGHLSHEFPRTTQSTTATRFADFARDRIAPLLNDETELAS